MQIHIEALAEKYLGLPTAAGRLTENNFIHVREQARCRVQGYCEKMHSYVAKEVLLKSVIQTLSAYSMNCFKLTRGLCKKITAIMSKFWLDGSLDKQLAIVGEDVSFKIERRHQIP